MSISGESRGRNLSTSVMVEAMEGNLAAYIMYCSCIPGAQVHQEADHISALTGIPQPSLNVVMRTRFSEDDAYERIAEIMEPFKARQVPMLPDWAVVDVTTPPDAGDPGKVVAADFFGESWELKPPTK